LCADGKTYDGLNCDHMKENDEAEFSFDITMSNDERQCYGEPITLEVNVAGYSKKALVHVKPICDCGCAQQSSAVNETCNGNGEFECGACVCNPKFTGLTCGCNEEKLNADDSNCTHPDGGEPCSGRGKCQCGVCLCNSGLERRFDGTYCECDSNNCPRFGGAVCNSHGTCKCNECICDDGWSGTSCECPTSTDKCINPDVDGNSTEVCSGNGDCLCNKCQCHSNKDSGSKYRGVYCENAPSTSCSQHKNCVMCKAFNKGEFAKDDLCVKNCSNYILKALHKDEAESYQASCTFDDLEDNCVYEAWYKYVGSKIKVEYRPEKVCNAFVDPTWLIIGVILAVVGIGIAALLVWKVYTSMKDAREYKNFIRESQNVKFEGGLNPIYKQATSTFQNPTFTPGKPSSSNM